MLSNIKHKVENLITQWNKLNLMTSSEIPLQSLHISKFTLGNHSGKPGFVGLYREGSLCWLPVSNTLRAAR